ncbi:hypothetical protein COLO4_37850 [Corchorus olitorius]|uniref:Uncharacterized protein n=1 Tax=Corchorus olitorius TaxID=93759 RepID=A0A1R3FYU2_9ROSI|nr:hypothetical protein COLO4_37850 [Corchorus olitorius]
MSSSLVKRERVQLSLCSLGRLKSAMKGSAMEVVIPKGILRWFSGRISKGGVYKILRFETVECKLSFVAIPSTYVIYFSTSTHVEEVLESIHMYLRYFFRFSSFEEICSRSDKELVLTDVIGVLTHVGEKSTIERSSGHGMVDKIDIMIKLLRVEFMGKSETRRLPPIIVYVGKSGIEERCL